MKYSLRTKLLFTIFLFIIIPGIVGIIVNYYILVKDFSTVTKRNNSMFAASLANNIGLFASDAYHITELAASNDAVTSFDPARQQQLAQNFISRYPFFQLMTIQDSSGMQTARSSGTLGNRANAWWFRQIMSQPDKPFVSRSFYGITEREPISAIVMPVYSNGQLTGVLTQDLKLGYIQKIISDFTHDNNISVYVIDGEGTIIAHPDPEQVRHSYNYLTLTKKFLLTDRQDYLLRSNDGQPLLTEHTIFLPEGLQRLVRRGLNGEISDTEFFNEHGQRMLAAAHPVQMPGVSQPWLVITLQESNLILSMVNSVMEKNLWLALFLLCGAAYFVWAFASQLVKDIGVVTRQINAMAENTAAIRPISPELIDTVPIELRQLYITFNKMAEQIKLNLDNLRHAEEKFSKAFLYASDVIGIMRIADEICIDVNDAFTKILGYSREEFIGNTSCDLGVWADPAERQAIFDSIHAGQARHNLDVRWRTKNGLLKSGILSFEIIDIGNDPCLLYVWQDITERKQAQAALQLAHDELEAKVEIRTEELTAMNEELRYTNEELRNTLTLLQKTQQQLVESEKMATLGRLVAGVSHEVNTPVGVSITAASHIMDITGEFSGLLQQNRVKQQTLQDYLSDVQEAAQIVMINLERAAKLVQNFKQVAVDQFSEDRRTFNVNSYLGEVLLSLQPKLKKTKQKITVNCDPDLTIHSFPGSFAQIIINLVMNSLIHAYSPATPGQITIAARKNAASLLVLTYTDDGKGIPPEILDRIFEPFFTTNRNGGTGLGLHILHNIVSQLLNGTIECHSELGYGTTFIITFPV